MQLHIFSHTNISCSMCIKSVCIYQQQRRKSSQKMSVNNAMTMDKCVCKLCGIRCEDEHAVNQHTSQCNVEKVCENCNLQCAMFSGIHSFYLHCILYKGSMFQCPFCADKIFTLDKYEKCKRHYLRCKLRMCLSCDEVFNTPKELKEHSQKEHPTYFCNICNAFFLVLKRS